MQLRRHIGFFNQGGNYGEDKKNVFSSACNNSYIDNYVVYRG